MFPCCVWALTFYSTNRTQYKRRVSSSPKYSHQNLGFVFCLDRQDQLRSSSFFDTKIIVALCLAAAIDAVEDPYPTQHTLIGWFPPHIHHQIAFCSLQSNSPKEKKRYGHKQALDIDEANTVSITVNHLPPRISLGLY
ncbi:hypothetical protein F2Q69_00011245 [Brassica cretica]|uniref:Uncharacterized protein n=1 Tax=Brassica cretica TaxID=69181 RepID=A0A8S9QPF1_BRACR|nr:hypothetical protein F2Q69_00011245 [Brassica cretica]